MKVTKGTIVRTILFVVVLVNMILKYLGYPLITTNETIIYEFVECCVSVGVLVLTFWKNNSFTESAKKADIYLEELKRLESEE